MWPVLLQDTNFAGCASIMERNFEAQKQLAPASSSDRLDEMYEVAKENSALGGKICGAGGGGAFVFYATDPDRVITSLKEKFVDCFEIDFEFEYQSIKGLNGM